MFDYKVQADNESMYNTPPTYALYIAGLVFQWLKRRGGLAEMEKVNIAKAQLIYDVLDASRFYASPVAKAGPLAHERAVHAPRLPSLDEAFLQQAKQRGLLQLKGHRSVGGMRASIYNAMPLDGVRALVELHAGVRAYPRVTDEMAEHLRILTLNSISHAGLKLLPADRYEVGSNLERPDAILVRSQDMHHTEIANTVRAIGRAGAGTNNIPVHGDEPAWRAGVQRPRGQCQRGQGAGAGGPAAERAQHRPGGALRRGAARQRRRSRQTGRGQQEALCGRRAAASQPGRHRPGPDRQPGGRRGHQAGHAGARVRSRDHGGSGLEPPVPGAQGPEHRGGAEEQRVRHPACAAGAGHPAPGRTPAASG